MLDPINALSLGANVIQVIDFSIKLVSKGYHIYKSADGSLIENLDTEAVAIDLQICNARLSQSLDQYKQSETKSLSSESLSSSISLAVGSIGGNGGARDDADEQALEQLCEACNKVASELVERLRRLKVVPGGKHREWKSVRQALKTVWSKDDLDAIATRLRLYRDQLNTRLLVSLR
jgi:hypothetical protein